MCGTLVEVICQRSLWCIKMFSFKNVWINNIKHKKKRKSIVSVVKPDSNNKINSASQHKNFR